MYTILVVEDNCIIQDQIENTIKQMNPEIKILKAATKKQALEILEIAAIDIFILDIKLPDGDGIDLAKIIRKHHPNHPIIIESSEGDVHYQNRIHDEIENLAFLEKPYEWEKLKTKMKRALDIIDGRGLRRLAIEQNGCVEFIEIDNIVYIEKLKGFKKLMLVEYDRKNQCLIEKIYTSITLTKLIEEMLPYKNALIRCHKSYIINPQKTIKWKISYHQGSQIILKHHIEIPVGKMYQDQVSLLV